MRCDKKLLLVILVLVHLVNSEPPLVGRWVENDKIRTGLYDFLWARGVSYFKRMYAAKWSTWKYEQTIIKEGNGYRVSGIKGPKQEVFSYLLTPDNTTVETIDFGILGGDRLTTAEFVDDNTLVSYCKDPATGQVDVIATRTILPNNPNIMYFKTKDVPLDYEMVATMIRQV